MATLSENIAQAIADFDAIKQAIISKGVSVGNVPTSQYANLIMQIAGESSRSLIPIMTSYNEPSGEVVTSSSLTITSPNVFDGYQAFNGQQANISSCQGGWLADSNDTSPYIAYYFDSAYHFTSVWLELCNNSTTTTRTLTIEGSNDGVTWYSLLLSTLQVSFVLNEYTYYNISLIGEEYSKIRISCNEPLYGGVNKYACTFSQIKVMGY